MNKLKISLGGAEIKRCGPLWHLETIQIQTFHLSGLFYPFVTEINWVGRLMNVPESEEHEEVSCSFGTPFCCCQKPHGEKTKRVNKSVVSPAGADEKSK